MTTEAITPLRHRMIEDMNARKLCAGTQRGHIRACRRFAAFLKRSPDTATLEDIRRFQLHLADTGVSICTRNCIMTGLRFLLRVTLRRLDLAEEVYGHALGLKIAAGNVPSFIDLQTGGWGTAIQDPLNSGQTTTMANFATL